MADRNISVGGNSSIESCGNYTVFRHRTNINGVKKEHLAIVCVGSCTVEEVWERVKDPNFNAKWKMIRAEFVKGSFGPSLHFDYEREVP